MVTAGLPSAGEGSGTPGVAVKCVETRRKAGMMSSQHGPYVQGYTHATMAATTRSEGATWSES